jgi:Tfp pilus assembly protein PilO
MIRPSGTALGLLGASVAAFGLVVGFLVVPALRSADERAHECGRLYARLGKIDSARLERDEIRERVESAQASSRAVLRQIPDATDQAALMSMLAVETGSSVLNQTVTAGEPVPATPRSKESLKAVPVTVEITATFDEVMGLLARAENDRRLVRAIRVEMEKATRADNRRDIDWDSPFVRATIELDAIYGSAAGSTAAASADAKGDEP